MHAKEGKGEHGARGRVESSLQGTHGVKVSPGPVPLGRMQTQWIAVDIIKQQISRPRSALLMFKTDSSPREAGR